MTSLSIQPNQVTAALLKDECRHGAYDHGKIYIIDKAVPNSISLRSRTGFCICSPTPGEADATATDKRCSSATSGVAWILRDNAVARWVSTVSMWSPPACHTNTVNRRSRHKHPTLRHFRSGSTASPAQRRGRPWTTTAARSICTTFSRRPAMATGSVSISG